MVTAYMARDTKNQDTRTEEYSLRMLLGVLIVETRYWMVVMIILNLIARVMLP